MALVLRKSRLSFSIFDCNRSISHFLIIKCSQIIPGLFPTPSIQRDSLNLYGRFSGHTPIQSSERTSHKSPIPSVESCTASGVLASSQLTRSAVMKIGDGQTNENSGDDLGLFTRAKSQSPVHAGGFSFWCLRGDSCHC